MQTCEYEEGEIRSLYAEVIELFEEAARVPDMAIEPAPNAE